MNTPKKGFWKAEQVKLEEERKAALEEKGFKPFFTVPEGETHIVVDPSFGVRANPVNAKSKILRISAANAAGQIEDWDLSCSQVLYKLIVKGLANDETDFTIIRVGKGKTDTRYSVKEQGET